MTSYIILKLALVLHIIGIVLLAGTSVFGYLIINQVWKSIVQEKQRAIALGGIARFLPVLIRIGAALLIISGVAMVAIYHGTIAEQVWFRIKIALVVLIILNVVLLARPAETALKAVLFGEGAAANNIQALKRKFDRFYQVQFFLLIVIFVLSAFRFN
jgi:uncharacterized membrane protein